MNRSVSDRIPCCELHYHGRIYLLDCGWDLSYLNVFLPPPAALRESKVVSPLDLPQLDNPVVELNGGVFLNTDPFIISYALDRIDWGLDRCDLRFDCGKLHASAHHIAGNRVFGCHLRSASLM